MARSEARISIEVWANESDFTALSSDAQWMYFFLLSQPDLAHDGVIALRERRWSQKAAGLKVEQIEHRIAELEDARYVVVDRDAEELLVRSFVRRDKVYRQPNVLRAALDHLPLVSSPFIMQAIKVELLRIQPLDMPEGSIPIIAEMLDVIGNPAVETPVDPSENPSPDPSGEGTAGTRGERGDVTAVSSDSPFPEPQTSDHLATAEPPPLTPEDFFGAPASLPEPKGLPHTHPKKAWAAIDIDTDPKWVEFWSAYPSIKAKGHARTAWLKALRNGVEPDTLIHGALAYRNDRGRDKDFTKHASTWLNAECWNDYDTPVADALPAGPRPFWEN